MPFCERLCYRLCRADSIDPAEPAGSAQALDSNGAKRVSGAVLERAEGSSRKRLVVIVAEGSFVKV